MESYFEVRQAAHGRGLYAGISFPKDETLFEIKGVLISCDEDADIDEETRSNTIRFDEELYLSPKGELSNFLNHSCNPNVKIVKRRGKLYCVSIRPLKRNDEMVFDYSTILASDDSWEMKCGCGANVCRGVVQKFDMLPIALQKKYTKKGVVPAYILRI